MRISITDKFLLDIYNFLEEIEGIGRFIVRRRRSMRDIYPDNPIIMKYKKSLRKSQFNMLVYYLKKNNYIKVSNLRGRTAIMLTDRGIDKIFRAHFRQESFTKKKRSDGKWIMLIFDIPKSDDKKRGLMRYVLKNLDYKMFQKSVWMTPYDVLEQTERFMKFYYLDQYARILLTEHM